MDPNLDLDEVIAFLTSQSHEKANKKLNYAPDAPYLNVLRTFFQSNLNLFHIRSFDAICKEHIPEIIESYGTKKTLLHDVMYTFAFSNVRISPSDITPEFAHTYSLHYTCDIFADITLSSSKHPAITKNILLAQCVLVTGSDPSSNYGLVGAFIVRGKIRTCPAIKTFLADFPLVYSDGEYTILEIRCAHRDKIYRSTSTIEFNIRIQVKQPKMLGFIGCRVPFAKKDIHVVVLACCFGSTPQKFIELVKFIAGDKYIEEKFTSYEVSILHNQFSKNITTQNDAFSVVSTLYALSKNSTETGRIQVQNEVFPHLKNPDPEIEYKTKLFYLASVTAQLILSHEKIIPVLPRDTWSNSQVITPANHIATLFRTLFIAYIRQSCKNLRKALMKDEKENEKNFRSTLANINLASVFSGKKRISERLASAVATGIWSPRRNGVTIALNTSNDDAIQLQLRCIYSALKQVDGEHKASRGLTKDQAWFICPCYSQDGLGIGLVYELAMTATLTPPVPNYMSNVINNILIRFAGDNLSPILDFLKRPFCLSAKQRFLMDTTGAIHFVIHDCDKFISMFRKLRRTMILDRFVFIADYNPNIVLQCREGLVARPLIIVDRVKDINSETTFEECISRGIIEYVSCQEQSTLTRIAVVENDITPKTTHVELLQAGLLGLIAGSIFFATCQQSARLTLICGQLKQVIIASVPKERGAQSEAHLYYAFRNLVTTTSASLRPGPEVGRGTPCIVAVCAIESIQEDAVLLKKSFVERGGMMAGESVTYVSEASTPKNSSAAVTERFEKPEFVLGKKMNSYDALEENGLTKEGTHVESEMIIIGKSQSILKTPGSSIGRSGSGKQMLSRRCISTLVRKSHGGQVTKSIKATLPEGEIARTRVETVHYFDLADKLTNEAAMKGVAAAITPDVNLPWSETTGMIPDVFFQPLGPVSRMTPSFVMAALTGKVVVLEGDFKYGEDTQDFATSKLGHMKLMENLLVQHGFQATGEEIFRDGETGELFPCGIYCGVIDVLRLNHLAESKVHSRSTGSVDPKTMQPRDGRKHGSGARQSEMEATALQAHGVSVITTQRFCDLSDKHYVYVCQHCQLFVDDIGDFVWCRRCASETKVRKVKLTWMLNMLTCYLNALGIAHFFKIRDIENIDVVECK